MKRLFILAAALAIVLSACGSFDSNENAYEGTYSCVVTLSGGSGKAAVESPAEVEATGGNLTVKLIWSSSNYDYMVVDDVQYDNEADAGDNSTFTVPFLQFDEPFDVVADTTAMSTPHEIEYEITVYSPDSVVSFNDEAENEDEKKDDESEASIDSAVLAKTGSLELEYSKEYSVDYYGDDNGSRFALITIGADEKQYFFKALDTDISDDVKSALSSNIIVLNDIDKTYLVSTSVMDLIRGIDAMDYIKFSGTRADGWYIDEARDMMDAGDISYAGKYSAPDYELLVSSGCNFAIENTMIYHSPKTKEKLEELGIPVMVERSGYEDSPLGRLEWVKLYGVIFDRLDEAIELFDGQKDRILAVSDMGDAGKTAGFFSISTNGQISVRKSGDYISAMIAMAGADYEPDIGDDITSLYTIKITEEDFYTALKDADVLIYNSTIEDEVENLGELETRLPMISDFKAFKDNNIYVLRESYFQKSTHVAEFIEELHEILMGMFVEGDCFYRLGE